MAIALGLDARLRQAQAGTRLDEVIFLADMRMPDPSRPPWAAPLDRLGERFDLMPMFGENPAVFSYRWYGREKNLRMRFYGGTFVYALPKRLVGPWRRMPPTR